MKKITLLLAAVALAGCAKTHKEPADLRHGAQRGFWSKTVSESYRRLYADVVIDLQREILACYGGGPVRGRRPGSGTNLVSTRFFPDIDRDDSNYQAVITIWRGSGAADPEKAEQSSRVLFIVELQGDGDGRSTVTVFGPRRGWNDEMHAFLHWAGGGEGQCAWR